MNKKIFKQVKNKTTATAPEMKFSIKDFFSEIWPTYRYSVISRRVFFFSLNKSCIENLVFKIERPIFPLKIQKKWIALPKLFWEARYISHNIN